MLYHGKKRWSIATNFFSLLNAPEELRPYLLDFPYQLSDFSHLSDEEIRGEIWLRVCLSILRAIFDPQLRHELRPLFDLVFELGDKETGIEYIRTILYYLTRATRKVSREALEQALLAQGSPGEKLMETIAQEYIQQGLQQGMHQGQEQGRLEATRNIARQLLKLHDVATVSKITGLTVDELQTLPQTDNRN